MVTAFEIAASVCDPEIPVLTIEDLGILRGVELVDGRAEVTIIPTYSGCPAMNVIALDITLALEQAGYTKPLIKTVLTPAWSTDMMSEAGRLKLKQYGIAPPGVRTKRGLFSSEVVECPQCSAKTTEKLAEFGSTSCKALWRCLACKEPFDYFKCI
jgi:ring-1,2-phenylacetyl-CoA epoxidase subunit PaaD